MDILNYLTLKKGSCRVLSTVSQDENEAEWLSARTKGIGGSDIGSICGINQYSSARLIYMKKTGQYDESCDPYSDAAKDRMHFGHVLEPVVAAEYAKRSEKKIALSPATFCHIDYPWALANVDRFIVDDEGIPYGILECKTAGEYMKDDWEDGEIPLGYIYQLNWYMWVCGLKYGAFACLVGGNKFYFYETFFNEEMFYKDILPKVEKFWNYNVKGLIEPELSGTDADKDYVNGLNSDVVRNSEILLEGDEFNELAQNVITCKAKIKEYEAVLEESINRIKDKLKSNEFGYTKDHVVKWSPRSQQRVNTEFFKENYPDIYEKVKKTINYRVFTVK